MQLLRTVDTILTRIVNRVHVRLFGHSVSPVTMPFLYNTLWSIIGGATAAVILLGTNILVGRLLGPSEYGKIALVSTIAQIAIVFVLFGMDRASMRSIAIQSDKEGQAAHLSTAFSFTLATSGILIIFALFIYPFLAKGLKVENALVLLGACYGIVLALRLLMDGFLRGLEWFKLQSVMRVVEATAVFGIFFFLWKLLPEKNYVTYTMVLMGVGLSIIGFYIYKIRSYLRRFSKGIFREQFSFGRIYFFGSVFGAFFGSLDKLFISKYLSIHDLGVYSAYYAASVGILAQVNTLLFNVFFPTVAKNREYLPSVVKKVDKLALLSLIPLFGLIMAASYLIMQLYGSSYEFSLRTAALFSFLAVLVMQFSINASLVQAYSKKAFQRLFYFGNISSLLFVGMYLVVIRFIGLSITWVVVILIGSYTASIALCKYSLFREGVYGLRREHRASKDRNKDTTADL